MNLPLELSRCGSCSSCCTGGTDAANGFESANESGMLVADSPRHVLLQDQELAKNSMLSKKIVGAIISRLAPRMRMPYGYFIKSAGPLLSSMHTSAGLSFFGVGIFYANGAIAS